MQQNLPMQILDKHYTSSGRSDDDHIEPWMKRVSSVGQSKSRSEFSNPPKKLPNPKSPYATKAKTKTVTVEQDHQDKHAQATEFYL